MPSQVTAAFITPECRANRGTDGAWDEAVARLRVEYDAILEGWKNEPAMPTLNLILTMDRPCEYERIPEEG
jgi:hypothetical protein